jgi:hypothetical protein
LCGLASETVNYAKVVQKDDINKPIRTLDIKFLWINTTSQGLFMPHCVSSIGHAQACGKLEDFRNDLAVHLTR